MRAGEDSQSEQSEGPGTEQTQENQSQKAAPPEDSLLDLMSSIVVLGKQIWRDRFALVKAEMRLAVSSLFVIAGLGLVFIMTLMLIWILLIAAVSHLLAEADMAWGWILALLLVLHGILAFYLNKQMKALIRSVSFPETRRAFSVRPQVPAEQAQAKADANAGPEHPATGDPVS